MDALRKVDPEVAGAIEGDRERQNRKIQLIASENVASRAVLEAVGSPMTNKYAEGYPGKRWYEGCRDVDDVERLARTRACELFGAEHANVQPHAGSQANMAVYFALLQPGDTVLAMRLDQGGHLTMGSPVNFSGKLFRIVSYGVRKEDERIDYEEVKRLARAERPKLIIAGASAYPRTIDFEWFRAVASEVGAAFMADIAHIAGLVAAGVHPSPVRLADFVTTTTHKTLRGPRGGLVLCKKAYAKELDRNVFPGIQGGPLMHVIAGKAVCFRVAMEEPFREYQRRVIRNAQALAESLLEEDLRLVTGGTDNHLLLLDLRPLDLTGKAVAAALDRAGITANKNMIPFDERSPFQTSGVRFGSPSMTSRGMGEDEMRRVGKLISRVVRNLDRETEIEAVRREAESLALFFPAYPTKRFE